MKSSGSAARSRGTRVLGIMAVASLLSGLLPSFAFSAEPRKPSSLETKPSSLELKAWRATMTRTPQLKPGCFEATYPSTEWHEVPCMPAPNRPYKPAEGPRPSTVGNGNDYAAQVAGTISSARGSFDTDTGFEFNPVFFYSLQLNTNTFKTSLCDGAANPATCLGWQQFVFSNPMQAAFMQYWLIDYGPQCPSGWTGLGSHCRTKSGSSSITSPQENPVFVELQGTAGSGGAMDVFIVTWLGGSMMTKVSNPPVFDLASVWKVAEFNVFGDGDGKQAILPPGNMIVRTTVNDGTTNFPTCLTTGFSGETNNYTLVPPCCRYGGPSPAIVFDQSTNAGATARCANGTSIGDTHLTNFNGLLYDFQAAGDFLLAEIDPDFVVQTRQKSGAPTWPNASINNAVAMKMGKTRLAICLGPNRFVVDGKPNDLGNGKSLSLPGVTVTRNGNVYVFTRPDGANVRVVLNNGWLDVSVSLGGQTPVVVNVRGLLGNANGDTDPDDLAARDGTVLHQPVSFTDLYHSFGDSWRVSSDESLLSQLCGDTKLERGNPKKPFYANDLNRKAHKRSRKNCTAAGVKEEVLLDACTLDTAVLGDKTAAKAFVRANPPRAVVRLGSRSKDAR
jgi:von Willebrand factor type D domain